MKILEKPPKETTIKVMRHEIQFHDNRLSTAKIKGNIKNQKKKLNDAKTARTQPAFTCSKLTIETLEKGVKYVQS